MNHHEPSSIQQTNSTYLMRLTIAVAGWFDQYLDRLSHDQLFFIEELNEGKLPYQKIQQSLEKQNKDKDEIALTRLTKTFHLDQSEILILLACCATELIPSFSRLCCSYHGTTESTTPTFLMIASLFENFDWKATSSKASLRNYQLIELKPIESMGHMHCPIAIDSTILNYLLGMDYFDESLTDVVNYIRVTSSISAKDDDSIDTDRGRRSSASPSFSRRGTLDSTTALLVSLWQRGIQEQYGTTIQLTGIDTANKENVVTTAARRLGVSIIELDEFVIPTTIKALSSLAKRLRRWMLLDKAMLHIKADGLNEENKDHTKAVAKLIELIELPVILSVVEPTDWGKNKAVIEVGTPSNTRQMELWQKYLHPHLRNQVEAQIPQLVAQFNLSANGIEAIATTVNISFRNGDNLHPFDYLWDSCRISARQKLDGLATRVTSNTSWQNLLLPDATKQQLASIISQVNHRAKVYNQWGMASHRGSGITALFSGTSGTGKTTAAEVIANELKLDLYKIELSTVISKYIGETEKNLQKIFDAAEAGGAILLFDEADALFGKRTEVKDSKDRHSNAEISYLLQKMEAYRGLAILTTNIEEAIDSAFKRRLRFAIKFDFPDRKARESIWRSVFPKVSPTEGLNYEILATMELSGGNIRSIALNAAFIAAACNEPIQMKHIVSAAKAEAIKLGSSTYELEMMVAKLKMNQTERFSPISSDSSIPLSNNNDSRIPEQSNYSGRETSPRDEAQPPPEAKNHCWSPEETYKIARKCFQRRDYQKGYDILSEGVTIYPHHSGLNFWMGLAAWEVRLNVPPTEIIAALNRALQGNGQWLDNTEGVAICWFLKAQIMERFQLADAKTCYDLYNKYLKAQPKGTHFEKAKSRRDELSFEAKFGKRPED